MNEVVEVLFKQRRCLFRYSGNTLDCAHNKKTLTRQDRHLIIMLLAQKVFVIDSARALPPVLTPTERLVPFSLRTLLLTLSFLEERRRAGSRARHAHPRQAARGRRRRQVGSRRHLKFEDCVEDRHRSSIAASAQG